MDPDVQEVRRAQIATHASPDNRIAERLRARHGTLAADTWRTLVAAGVLLLVDWLAVAGCLAASWWLRSGPLLDVVSGFGPLLPLSTYFLSLYGLAPWLLAFAGARLYTQRKPFWGETHDIWRALTLAALFAVFLSFADRTAGSLSRLVIAGVWLATLVVLPLVRYNTKRLLLKVGVWHKRILIVGTDEAALRMCERLRAHPALGYEPVAFVDDEPTQGRRRNGLPVCGPLEVVPQLVQEFVVKDVVVAMPQLPRDRLQHLISLCEGYVQSIRVVPDMFGIASAGIEAEDLDGVLLLHMRYNLAKQSNVAMKRAFDLVVATVGTLALAPIVLLIAVAIRIDSPGPIFFLQERLGRGQRSFRCIKFRTMYVDADQRVRTHLADDPEGRAEWERFAKLKSADPRVTRAGRVLRRTSLDELPQLANVFRNEMSLVGPRPYLPSEAPRMSELIDTILKAPPGITGLWQVSGRNRLTFEQRLRVDEYYVRNWSLWMDVVVLVKTIRALARRDGAY